MKIINKILFASDSVFHLDSLTGVSKSDFNDHCFKLILYFLSDKTSYSYEKEKDRDMDYNRIKEYIENEKKGTRLECINQGGTMLDSLKSYFNKNQETFYTIGLIILIDHFVFNGAFRDKIKQLVDKLINKTEKQLENK